MLFLGLIPLAGFTAFVPLYVDDLNVSAGVIFALYGVLILGVRIFGARVPDRLGGRNTGDARARRSSALGIGLIAAWPTVAGLVRRHDRVRGAACRSCIPRCCCSRSTA